jgi:methyl-accepting chemotaxis protein
MSMNLNGMIGSIGEASGEIEEGARQVSVSGVALASGATAQARAVEEFSASLEEISAQTTQNAERAGKANELSRAALLKAEEGNAQMQAMLTAMSEINKASEAIAKIIKVIDDIAFQTNILALNAAVEAARAGEHGKGFAVVAEEVRNLAARSAEAAKQTTASIGQSIKEVENGTRIADATADRLGAIVSGVSTAAALVGDIANACAQQVTAIGQMDQGINQITVVMQANSATSVQNSAASEALLNQAEFMKKQVSHFSLRDQDAPAALPQSVGANG